MARKPARTTTRTVGTSISNSNYSQSTKQNSNVFSGISNTETKGTLEYYESHPNTAISYDSDNYYGVYLYSKIYIKNNDSTFYYYILQNLFNIDYEQANLILNSCKTSFTSSTYDDDSSHGDVDNTTIITLTKPIFLNNIDYKTFFSNITTKYNYESTRKDGVFKFYKRNESETSKNIYTLIYKKHNDSNGHVVAYFQIIFKKITPFNGKEVELNDVNQLFYNKYAVEFNSNIDIDDINIQYCDLFNYIWFRVKSKTEIKNIKLDNNFVHNNHYNPEHKDILTCYSYVTNNMYNNIEIKINDGDGLEDIDYTYYGNTHNWKYYKSSYNEYIYNSTETIQVTQESENPEWSNTQSTQTVSVSTCNNINSINWYKSEFDNTNKTYIFEFKLNTIGLNNDARITTNSIPPAVWLCGENFLYSLNNQNKEHTSSLNISLIFKEDSNNTSGEGITNAKAIQPSANTHCYVDYTNPIKLYNNLVGAGKQTACIFRLKDGETDFNGNITVFYGNDLVYPYKKSGNEIIKGNGEGYKNSAFYYIVERSEDRLYVYLKTTKNTFKLKNFINIYMSDDTTASIDNNEENITYSNVNSKISQDEITVHSVDISIPQISSGDKTVYIDNSSNNKTKHYTNYTKLPTVNGYTYYGIRAYAYINDNNEIEYIDPLVKEIGVDGLSYNVNANIVKLNPRTEQNVIYSFKNGEQLLVLNNDYITLESDVNNDNKLKFKNRELLPSYLFSYEYIVEGINNNSNNQNDDYNLKFKLLYSNKNLVETTYQNIPNEPNPGLYYAYISYTYNESLGNNFTYNKLINVLPDYPITQNIDNDLNNNVFTYKFIKYTDKNEITDENNIYEKVIQYVKISLVSLTLDSFINTVKNSESNNSEYNKYYKYSSITNVYSPYKYDDVKDLKELPLNIYVKYEYYLKTGESKKTIGDLSKSPRYKNDYQYLQVTSQSTTLDINDILSSNEEYYQCVDNTYIPYKGFIHDGSVEYYGFKYRPIDDECTISKCNSRLNRRFDKNSLYYIKQNYKALETSEINIDKLAEYKLNNIILYKNNDVSGDVFKFISIDSNTTIYDIDLTGNTIYSYLDRRDGIISLIDIKDAINSIAKDEWFKDADIDTIKRNPESKYLLNNFDINGQKIKYIVSLEGNFKEIDYNEAKNILINNSGNSLSGIYVNETGFNTFKRTNSDRTYSSSDIKCINNLKTYKVNDKLYTLLLTKLTANELSDNYKYLKVIDNKLTKYLYKVNDKYYNVDKRGIIYKTYLYDNINEQEPINYSSNSDAHFDFYKFIQSYEKSYDIHMSINKQYFIQEKTKKVQNVFISDLSENKNINNESPLLVFDKNKILTGVNLVSDPTNYSYSINDVKFYEYKTTYYTYCDNEHITISSLNNDLTNIELNPNYNNIPNSCYTGDVLFKSKYFYNSYCINDGINIDKNGSYYTNALVFDGKSGKISKKLYLNHHIQNLTKYSYDIITTSYITLDKTEVSNDISIYNYDKYYISYTENNGELSENYYQLSQESLSPAYYVNSNGYSLYYKIDETSTYEYNALDSYQLNINNVPSVIQMNNQFYGIIFNIPITYETYSYSISFTPFDKLCVENIYINGLDITSSTKVDKFDQGDNTTNNNQSDFSSDIIDSALVSANNELYYNNYLNTNNDSLNLYIGYLGFIPNKYLYELVELSEFNFRNYNSDKTILQTKDIITNSININKPFNISNEQEIIFDGTYTWVQPAYKEIVLDNGEHKTIVERDGYFHKNYSIEEKPFKISSYNFYPKDEVSSINITYNFIPNSYILTAEIDHPSISYVAMVNEIVERERYTYILNGFEYDYPSTSPITFENDTYYGTINVKDIDNSYGTLKVTLYKKNDIVTTTNIKEIEHQHAYTSKEYFSYLQATPLTNEKIPVLYNTELIPATSHKVQFWDINTNSYSIKNVIDSYAYYSYKYKYETVPFTVASYIFTEDLRISNFNELGTYVSVIGESIGEQLLSQSYNVNKLSYDLGNIFNKQINQDKQLSQTRDDIIKSYSSLLNITLNNFNDNTYSGFTKLSESLNKNFNDYKQSNSYNFENISYIIKSNISEQYNIIKEGLDNTKTILEQKIGYLTDTLHSDIIGEGVEQEKEVTTTITTYTPKPQSPIVPAIGPLSIVAVAQTITEKNKPVEYTYETETKTETIKTTASSLAEILAGSLMSTSKQTIRTDNEDGSYIITQGEAQQGIGDILKDLKISRKVPDYNEFMCDLVPKLFSSIDFEADYDIKYDVHGNVISKKKRNPSDMAKKCISNADSLWKEMKKKGIVS